MRGGYLCFLPDFTTSRMHEMFLTVYLILVTKSRLSPSLICQTILWVAGRSKKLLERLTYACHCSPLPVLRWFSRSLSLSLFLSPFCHCCHLELIFCDPFKLKLSCGRLRRLNMRNSCGFPKSIPNITIYHHRGCNLGHFSYNYFFKIVLSV